MSALDYLDKGYTANYASDYGAKLTVGSFDNSHSYAKIVAITALVILAAGIFAIICYWTAMLSRRCVPLCRCMPSQPSQVEYQAKQGLGGKLVPRWSVYRVGLELSLYGSLALLLVFDAYTIVGRDRLTEGLGAVRDSVEFLSLLVTNLTTDGEQLETYGQELTVLLEEAELTCPYLSDGQDLQKYLKSYNESVQSILSVTGDLHNFSDNALDYMDFYAEGALFYCLFGVLALFPLLQAAFHYLQKQTGVKALLLCNNALYLLCILLGTLWCVFIAVTGDFCQAPSQHLAQSLTGTVQNVTVYYATCVGQSYVTVNLQEGFDAVEYFQQQLALVQFLPGCGGNAAVLQMQGVVYAINDTLLAVQDTTQCTAGQGLHQVYNEVVYQGVCAEGVEGGLFIWGAQIFAACFLLLFIAISSVAYQFYPPVKEEAEMYAAVSLDELDDDEEGEEEEEERGGGGRGTGEIVSRALEGEEEEKEEGECEEGLEMAATGREGEERERVVEVFATPLPLPSAPAAPPDLV